MRRLLSLLPVPLLLLPVLALFTSCGSTPTNLQVSIAADQPDQKPHDGDTPSYTITVVNNGPGDATGVNVRVDLAKDFTYAATKALTRGDQNTLVRTQPQDPSPNTASPAWGTWTLAAPQTQADGTRKKAQLAITFTATVGSSPGDYKLTAHALTDAGDDVVSPAAPVTVVPAAKLSFTVDATKPTCTRNTDVNYRVTAINTGTANADRVTVLVTLPGSITFLRTDAIEGNSSRSGSGDPVAGTLIPEYQAFTIPPQTATGPGQLVIRFSAHCAPTATPGTYTVTGQLTDASGTVMTVPQGAPVTVG